MALISVTRGSLCHEYYIYTFLKIKSSRVLKTVNVLLGSYMSRELIYGEEMVAELISSFSSNIPNSERMSGSNVRESDKAGGWHQKQPNPPNHSSASPQYALKPVQTSSRKVGWKNGLRAP